MIFRMLMLACLLSSTQAQTIHPLPEATFPQPVPASTPTSQRVEPSAETLAHNISTTYREFVPILHSSQAALAEPALQGAPYYHMQWQLKPSLDILEGEQSILYTNRTGVPLPDIGILFLPNIMGGAMSVRDLLVNGAPAEGWQVEGERLHALRVQLAQPLAPGQQVRIGFSISLEIPHSGAKGYSLLALQQGILSLGHAYGMVASYEDDWQLAEPPLYGDLLYSEASFFEVDMLVPPGLVVASSGELREDIPQADGNRRLRILAGPARDFFLSASYDYAMLSQEIDGYELRSFYIVSGGESARAQSLAMLQEAATSLQFFSQQFGAYPYRQLDIVPLHTRALGMEFPGIIAMSDGFYSGAQRFQGASMRTRLINTVVHEVAHQWFYNLVGNDQRLEPWLDEAPTQYITLRYHQRYHPADYDYYEQEIRRRAGQAVALVDAPVATYSPRDYITTIYGSAPLRFLQMEALVGEQTFTTFLQEYVRRYQWQQASQKDFFNLLLRYADATQVREGLEPWFSLPASP